MNDLFKPMIGAARLDAQTYEDRDGLSMVCCFSFSFSSLSEQLICHNVKRT